MTARYAIYFLPDPETDLGRFGRAWLGWDVWTGEAVEPCGLPAFTAAEHGALVSGVRRYGFHATLKAPFRLSSRCSLDCLLATADRFAAAACPVRTVALTFSSIGRFLAVVPARPASALNALAAACVTAFDDLREPLRPEDRARRRPDALTARQRVYLERWGYPYVLEDFRFHLTLTDPLTPGQMETVRAVLRARLAPCLDAPVDIETIALVVQPAESDPFRLQQLFRLRGAD